MRSSFLFTFLVIIVCPSVAVADSRGVLRVGVVTLDLAPTDATPYLGGRVDDIVGAYNGASDAYNEAHGYPAGSEMASGTIDRDDLGVRATLVTVAPALEVGGDHYFFRLEGVAGFGDDLRALGVGVYPINLAAKLRGGDVRPYLSAGGTASWLDRIGGAGEIGGLVTARVAVGVRVGRASLEIGYGAFVMGALVDRGRLNTMTDYDPRGDAPPPRPETAIAGGEQRGMVDLSLGLSL